MKKFVMFAVFSLINTVSAQQLAITDTGHKVYLMEDGTWSYVSEEDIVAYEIPKNEQVFIKSKNADFQLKSKINPASIWIDAKKWDFKAATDNPDAEYEFKLKGKDLYGMLIVEQLEIDLENLANTALENAKNFAPNATLGTKEMRTVNGTDVLHMTIKGKGNGIKFQYLGYYYSDENGSTQFLVYTGESLVERYETEIFELLNGLEFR